MTEKKRNSGGLRLTIIAALFLGSLPLAPIANLPGREDCRAAVSAITGLRMKSAADMRRLAAASSQDEAAPRSVFFALADDRLSTLADSGRQWLLDLRRPTGFLAVDAYVIDSLWQSTSRPS